jgi:PIN domain nuclease of toxin-antitoxin system
MIRARHLPDNPPFDRFLTAKANPHRYTFDSVDRVVAVDRTSRR